MKIKFNLASILIFLGLTTGQLIKIPNSTRGGLTILDLSVVILTLISLISLRFRLKNPPRPITIALIFTIILLVSLLLTPLHLSAGEYLDSIAYSGRFFLYILFGWTLYSGALPGLKERVPQTIAYSGVALAILGFFQLILFPNLAFLQTEGWDPHYLRLVSTLLDPNFLGGFFTLCFITLLSQVNSKMPTIPKVMLGIIYLALLLTFSRSAYLTFGLALLAFSFFRKSPKMVLISLLLIGGLGLGYLGYQHAIAQPRGINRQQSAQYRISSWQTGWEMFNHSPVLGVGFNAYRYALTEYNLTPKEFTQTRGASANDSSLLFILSTTGIIGFAVFLLFLGSLARQNTLLLTGLTGIIAQSFFINSLFYPWILIWIVLTAVQGEEFLR